MCSPTNVRAAEDDRGSHIPCIATSRLRTVMETTRGRATSGVGSTQTGGSSPKTFPASRKVTCPNPGEDSTGGCSRCASRVSFEDAEETQTRKTRTVLPFHELGVRGVLHAVCNELTGLRPTEAPNHNS
uniref:Uncharacterized protein n=1 Tax=Chromera velia CCMP2878 TaxID=1169474 RepID=A0A0G4I4M0_9ALVE|eukprot:Cvel_10935.t1-p1 / transcript=Cvel_10935.t1 / gene=Cvel_10935 / organism=Chromera_velia_CCMP2878 / gene_product=hypothetical protein / transcript_product=hypothetical protein / location=Cvel_scaffold672:47998-48476(-) / protein_length=128 / sequence_SO=supercontig / SO=protein_coding / is_pseudo=false